MAEEKRTLKTEVTADFITDGAQQNVTELQRLLTELGTATAARKEELEEIKVLQDEVAANQEAIEEGAADVQTPGRGSNTDAGGGIGRSLAWMYAKHKMQARFLGVTGAGAAAGGAMLGYFYAFPSIDRKGEEWATWLENHGGVYGSAKHLGGRGIDSAGNYLRDGTESVTGGLIEGMSQFVFKLGGLMGDERMATAGQRSELASGFRKAIRDVVFRDPEFDRILNDIVTQAVLEEIRESEQRFNEIDGEIAGLGLSAENYTSIAEQNRRLNNALRVERSKDIEERIRLDEEYYVERAREDSD